LRIGKGLQLYASFGIQPERLPELLEAERAQLKREEDGLVQAVKSAASERAVAVQDEIKRDYYLPQDLYPSL